MIDSFHIKNFKGLSDLDLPLTRLTLLGGRNNVGKSTVLEALFGFHYRFNSQFIISSHVWRGMGGAHLVGPDQIWAPSFTNYDLGRPIELTAQLAGVRQTVQVKYLRDYVVGTQTGQGVSNGSIITAQKDQSSIPSGTIEVTYDVDGTDLLKAHTSVVNGQLTYSIDLNHGTTPPSTWLLSLRSHENETVMANAYGQLDIYGKQGTVLRFVNLLDPRIKALSVVALGGGDMPVIHADIGIGRKLPVAYLGDGVHRLLSIVIQIAVLENSMLLVDEIDSGLHYSVLPKVWQAIAEASQEFNCQVVGTTHSYECLEAANEALGAKYAKDFSFIRLDRRGDTIVPKVYDFELFAEALKSNLELR
jgi:hypothetical protein